MNEHGGQCSKRADIRGAKACLNGAGIRYEAIFNGLRCGPVSGAQGRHPRRSSHRHGTKRMTIEMLRDIDSSGLDKPA
ncbi:MAG: hypothetical protein NVSMB34_11770 [Variovorax sp.]